MEAELMAVVSAVPRTGLGSREGCQEAGGLGDAGAGDTRSDLAPSAIYESSPGCAGVARHGSGTSLLPVASKDSACQ